MLQKLIRKVKRKLGLREVYPSETSKVRHLLLPYCSGYGCDVGFGGDKITPSAVGIDLPQPYAHTGRDKVDVACDVIHDELPVGDNSYDYVYSSHLIEDFEDTTAGLKKFIRVLKSGGLLILVFPDQQQYEKHCRRTGQSLNLYHKHADMGLDFMIRKMQELSQYKWEIIFQSNCAIDYNVILVLKIYKNGQA